MIKKILPNLFLGDFEFTKEQVDSLGINYVLTVNLSKHELTTDHVPLWDGISNEGYVNDPVDYFRAVSLIKTNIREGKKVLVHCRAGLSRSVFIIMLYLYLIKNESLHDIRHFFMNSYAKYSRKCLECHYMDL